MTIKPTMNVRSVLGLIASDFAYKDNIQLGDLLQTHPDNKQEDENGFPSSLYLALGNEPLTQFVSTFEGGVSGVKLTQWEVVKVTQDASDGFGVVILKSAIRGLDGKFDYIVALRGSDGENRQDWFANMDLASTLWREHSAEVISYLMNLQTTGDIPRLNRIHFTGQSLGGGLAQYAAYDFALAMKNSNRTLLAEDLTLTTFNGFGGVRGLQQLAAADATRGPYDPNLLSNVVTAHYSIDNDLVHRLGGGAGAAPGGSWHVNGAGNTYRFPFRRYDSSGPVAGEQNFLSIVEGHRIESGFYRGFERTAWDFRKAIPETIEYIDSDAGRALGAAFSRIGNKGFSTETSALVRLLVGAAAIGMAGGTIEIFKAASALATGYRNGGETGKAALSTIGIATLAIGTRLAATQTVAIIGFGSLFASYLEMLSQLSGEQKSLAYTALNSFMPVDRQVAQATVETPSDPSSSELDVRFRLAAIALASQFLDDPDAQDMISGADEIFLAQLLRDVELTAADLAGAILGADPRRAFEDQVAFALAASTFTAEEKTYLAVSLADRIQDIANNYGADDAAYLARTEEGTEEFLVTLAESLANAAPELLESEEYPDGTNPLFLNASLTHAEYRQQHDILVQARNDPQNAGIRTILSDAIELVNRAGGAIEIKPGASSNPFNDPDFDPDADPNPSSTIVESAARSYTVFLPYVAGEGGQHIRMKLEGSDDVDDLKVIAGGVTLTVDGGEFELIIDEGQRALTFALVQSGDIDTDSNITLSATLTDDEGNATHQTHVELNLTLDATEEGDFEEPETSNAILGDQDPAGNGNLKDILDGTAANDLILAGLDDDDVSGFGGDDVIEAGDGNDTVRAHDGDDHILGGAGNDYLRGDEGKDHIEGGAGDDLVIGGDGDYLSGEDDDDLLEGGSGNDIVEGEEGDDRLFSGTQADSATAFDDDSEVEATEGTEWLVGGHGDDVLIGGTGIDILVGGGHADVLAGAEGDDFLFGDRHAVTTISVAGFFPLLLDEIDPEGGDDALFGGAGNDALHGEIGNDALFGGAGDDELFGDSDDLEAEQQGNDYLDGGAGADVLVGGGGNDDLIGGDGNDELFGDSDGIPLDEHGDDYLEGDAGDDLLQGGGGNDILIGGTGDDLLLGEQGDDELYGGEGVDELDGNEGDDYVDGGVGNDLVFGGLGQDTLLGDDGDDQLTGDLGAEDLDAGDDDWIEGGAGNDALFGQGGDDTLFGDEGDDQLQGGAGNDYLDGGEGDDTLMRGGDGDDTLAGGQGTDVLDGGAGQDTYLFERGDSTDVVLDTGDREASVITFGAGISRDDIHLALGQAVVDVGEGPSRYTTLVLDLGGGDAIYVAGLDPSDLEASNLFDYVSFADGTSITYQSLLEQGVEGVDVDGTDDEDVLSGTGANDLLDGNGGDDELYGYLGNDALDGGEGDDALSGGEGDDALHGDAGADALDGGSGDDALEGGDGDDMVLGAYGDDTLTGGAGDDILIGNDGSDIYTFGLGDGRDVVNEQADTSGTDVVRFDASVASAGLTLLRQANGDLVVRYGTSDELRIVGQYADATQAIEGIEFADGTVIDSAALDALPIAPITGTSGDDTLTGTSSADEFAGLAGADTYSLRFGMGKDTIVDASPSAAEVGTLALGQWVTLDSLMVTRQGDDLAVDIRGTQDGVLIKDYFSGAEQHWQIAGPDGALTALEDLVDLPDPYADDEALAAREAYRQSTLSSWSMAQSFSPPLPTHAWVEDNWSQTTITFYTEVNGTLVPHEIVQPPSTYFNIYNYSTFSGREFSPVSFVSWEYGLTTTSQVSDDEVITTQGTSGVSSENLTYGVRTLNSIPGYGWYSHESTTSFPTSATSFNTTESRETGAWKRLMLTPGGGGPAQVDTLTIQKIHYERVVEDIVAGDSDNTIYGAGGAGHVVLIDAGGGNDTVFADDDDFVYGNDGDDVIYGGALVYGGNGADTVYGGSTVYGGAGDDYLADGYSLDGGSGDDYLTGSYFLDGGSGDDHLAGLDGATTFHIEPDQFGADFIEDLGGIDVEELTARYLDEVGIGVSRYSEQSLDNLRGLWSVRGDTFDALIDMGWEPPEGYEPRAAILEVYDDSVPGIVFYATLDDLRADLAAIGFPYDEGDVWRVQLSTRDVTANDYRHLEPFYDLGLIEQDTVEFGAGVSLADLTMAWSTTEDEERPHAVLELGWGAGHSISVMIPRADDLIGAGIERFAFDDGTVLSMGELLALAPPAPIDGDLGPTRYRFEAGDIGIVQISDSATASLDYNDWYYDELGIAWRWADVDNAPLVRRDDTAMLQQLIEAGVLDKDVVDFGTGLALEDLSLELVVDADSAQAHPEQPSYDGGVLRVRWNDGESGFDLDVPDVSFGDGDVGMGVEVFRFADGTELWLEEILQQAEIADLDLPGIYLEGTEDGDRLVGTMRDDTLVGLDGNDTLRGGGGNDTLDGGGGSDQLVGGHGDDLYIYYRDSGFDTIADSGGDSDTLRLVGLLPDDIWAERGSDLYIYSDDGDITILGWPGSLSSRIERIEFDDGIVWSAEDLYEFATVLPIDLWGTDGNDVLTGTDGKDNIFGRSGDDLLEGLEEVDFLYGGDGADTLIGGAGDDYLDGGAGADLYLFTLGDGFDDIDDYDYNFPDSSDEDVVRFDASIAPQDVRVARDQSSLYLVIGEGSDRIRLSYVLEDDPARIERIEFANGEVWSHDDMVARAGILPATEQDDVLWGSDEADTIDGLGGYDEIFGNGGDDVIDGGADDDSLYGGEGHDILRGGDGWDYFQEFDDTSNLLEGGAGEEYMFVRGNSLVIGGSDDDNFDLRAAGTIVAFNAGDGNDTIYATEAFTLSLGGGIGVGDLALTNADEEVAGEGVVLLIGGDDSIVIPHYSWQEGWASITLQVFGSAHTYDFTAAIDAFFAAQAADPELTEMSLDGVLQAYEIGTSETEALGGAIAYEYATTGSTSGLSVTQIQSILADPNFGFAPQSIEAPEEDNGNDAPLVTAGNATLLFGSTVAAQSLFSVSDADGDAITQYEFWDSTAGDGHWAVDGVEQGVNASILVSADDLDGVTFTASSAFGSDQVWARAYDGEAWSAWKSWNVASAPHATNAAPVVTAAHGQLLLNESVEAAGLFDVTDADGDAILSYEFWDDVAGGGYFALDGVAQGSNPIAISAAQLADLDYVASATPGTEQVWVRANDGMAWSAWKPWNMTSALHIPNAAPAVSVFNGTVLLGQSVDAATFFSASDADGDPVASYEFFDSTAGNGHFTVDGVEQGVNVGILVTAAQLADTQFVGAGSAGSDLVWVRANDGQSWGEWKSWTVNSWPHATNAKPVADAPNVSILTNQVVEVADLFSVTDADGDTITQYEFWDDVAGGGYFRVNGVQQGAVQAISASNLGSVEYVGGASGGAEQVWVRANDGLEWSAWESWNIETALHIPNAVPTVSASNSTVLLGESVDAAALFSTADADGDPITKYEFWDSTAGNGHFTVNGVQGGVNVAIAVTAAQLAGTQFHAASAIGSDLVWVRANDGQNWSDWKSWNVQSSPHLTNAAPVVAASVHGVLRNEAVQATSLFSVSDADADAITQYELWDDVNGGGHWEVDGVQQAAAATIAVSAADLADTVYVGGANAGTEQVWARAYDGMAWSTWKNWLMSTEGGMLRGGLAPDTLTGEAGPTVLEGGGGDDDLTDTEGNNVFSGGEGEDEMTGGAGNDLFVGGAGNDTAHTGDGYNVIAYNQGGGMDTVYSGAGASNTLSLGGGLSYDDLSLSRDGNDLLVNTGGDNRIALKDWYAGKDNVGKLQLTLGDDYDSGSADPLQNRRVQSFDFLGMVAQFDAALAQSPGLSSWAMTNALLQAHLAGSDEAAVGGDLAYWYGRNGGLTGISLNAAQQVLGAANFGSDAQALRPFAGLEEGLIKLG
jgi:Ca2+-binding RTX toxin-like protein